MASRIMSTSALVTTLRSPADIILYKGMILWISFSSMPFSSIPSIKTGVLLKSTALRLFVPEAPARATLTATPSKSSLWATTAESPLSIIARMLSESKESRV